MSLTSQFKTNTAKETEGVAIEYGANADGSIPAFHISRMSQSNPRYTRLLESKTRPYRRQLQLGTIDPKVSEKLMMEVFTGSVLLGWENVLMSDVTGDATEEGFADFTQENACKLFANLPEIYLDLQAQASSAAMFRDEAAEEDAKN